MEFSRAQKWNAISLGAAVLAAILVRLGMRAAWKMARDDSPPLNPLREEGTWKDAILFSLTTGLVVGLARLGARAVAAATLDRTGE